MIQLKEVCYTRLGTRDLSLTRDFSIKILGLQAVGKTKNEQYFRSDERNHTLYYFEGDPADQVVGFEIGDSHSLDEAGRDLEASGYSVHRGKRAECESRHVHDFIRFNEPNGTAIEVVERPEIVGSRYYGARDAGITGFSHIGLFTRDPIRDEIFWTQVCNARVSDRVGDLPLLRISAMHHSLALVPSERSGIQHINHQVASTDDVLRSFGLLEKHRVPIIFGPGRHPTSSARFLYFEGPDGMVFEYSVGISEVDEDRHRERQFGFEPASLCMWGAKAVNGEMKA